MPGAEVEIRYPLGFKKRRELNVGETTSVNVPIHVVGWWGWSCGVFAGPERTMVEIHHRKDKQERVDDPRLFTLDEDDRVSALFDKSVVVTHKN